MRAVLGFIVFFALVLLGTAQAQYVFQGRSTPLSTRMVSGHKAAAGGGYQGPGDSSVIGPALAWWATFSCYTSAYSGNVMDVANGVGGTATVGSRIKCNGAGTAGAISSSTACTFLSGTTTCSPLATTCTSTCSALILYDQTGNNSCSGNPCDQPLQANGPPTVLTSDLSASFPCITNTAANFYTNTVNNITQNQAFTIAMLSKRISGVADIYGVVNNGGTYSIRLGYGNASNAATMYAGGTFPPVTASDTHYHALVGVFNNASSNIYVDGTSNPINISSPSGFSAAPIGIFGEGGTTNTTFCEGGLWNGDIGATKAANYSSNVVARYGTLP